MQRYSLSENSWTEEEISVATDVLRSGNTTMGPRVKEFEEKFAKMFGSKYAIMSNSGSSANLLAVGALYEKELRYNKEKLKVIVPCVSWATTYYPFHQYGMELVFCDVDLNTLNYDLVHLEKLLSEHKISVICAVNLLGNPNDWDKLNTLAGNIPIIEDNCESMGAKYDNRFTGTFGIAGTFSTFFSHHISTMEGGITLTDDEGMYHFMLAMRAHGWTRNLPEENKVSGKKSNSQFEESFKFVVPGYNLRPLEISAAIGLKQLDKFDIFIENRRKNAQLFTKEIVDRFSHKIIFQKEIGESSWFGFTMIFENQKIREKAIAVFADYNIDCRPIVTGNFLNQPVIGRMNCVPGKQINADRVHNCGLFVGNHHFTMESEFKMLESALQFILQ